MRSSAPSDPLIIVADHRRVFVFSIRQKQVIGYIRGHGGVSLFSYIPLLCFNAASSGLLRSPSTLGLQTFLQRLRRTLRLGRISCDPTVWLRYFRIYNLDHPTVSQTPENPAWPPWNGPSLGSAAHGADGFDALGDGCGHCFQLLVGGRSGMCSAIGLTILTYWMIRRTRVGRVKRQLSSSPAAHSDLWSARSLIFSQLDSLVFQADRHVKIWRILSDKSETLCRDDKPLFSARITTSRVLSIAWWVSLPRQGTS